MTILYDGHGAPITESIHEPIDSGHEHGTVTDPPETWVLCVCGVEKSSQASAGGGCVSTQSLWDEHLEDVGADA